MVFFLQTLNALFNQEKKKKEKTTKQWMRGDIVTWMWSLRRTRVKCMLSTFEFFSGGRSGTAYQGILGVLKET